MEGEPLSRQVVMTAKTIKELFEDVLAQEDATLATWVVLNGVERGRWASQTGLAKELRIEGATVADAGRSENPSQVGHHLERRHSRALLDRQDPGARPVAHGVRPSSACLTAARRVVFAWASGPASVHPAAFS